MSYETCSLTFATLVLLPGEHREMKTGMPLQLEVM
jgi:hypothetical protein